MSKDKDTSLDPDRISPTGQSAGVVDGVRFDHAALLLFGGIAALFLLTFRDYGYSWDEVWQNRWYGQAVLRFLQTFGADHSALNTNNFYLYGGLYDALAELIPTLTPLDGFEARRLANAATGLIALVGAWKTARLLSGPQAGLWTLLFLVATPVWYGHIFINAKDIPLAAAYIWSLYYILKIALNFPYVPWKTAAKLGVAFGFAIGIRIGGVLVVVYYLLVVFLYLMALLFDAKSLHSMKTIKTGILYKIPLSLAVAWAMMVAFWPAVLLHPVRGLVEAFQATSHFQWGGAVLYDGVYVKATELPWHYLPVYFGVKLPVPILVMFVIGISWGILRMIQAVRPLDWQKILGPGLLVFAILFPPVYAISVGSTLYDGIRHFLFIIPPMACLAGMSLAAILPRIKARFQSVALFFYSASAVYLAFHVWTMIQLHPYQYAYLNSLAGGMPAAAAKYETDYWITSYREATLEMLDYAREYAQREGVPFEKRRFDVAVFGNALNVKALVPENFFVIDLSQAKRADFYIGSSRMQFDQKLPQWRVVKRVERMGMLFAVLKTSLPPLTGEEK